MKKDPKILLLTGSYGNGHLRVSKGETVNKTIDSGVDLITKENVKQRIDFINHVLK